MQTTQIRRGSSFQERDSDERFSNRSRRGGYGYGNNYDDDDRYNNRSSRYDEDDFDQSGRYGRSSRFRPMNNIITRIIRTTDDAVLMIIQRNMMMKIMTMTWTDMIRMKIIEPVAAMIATNVGAGGTCNR